MFRSVCLVLCLMVGAHARCQPTVDSLKQVLRNVTGLDEIRILNLLCYELAYVNADSARIYGLRALDKQSESDSELLAETLHYLAITHQVQSSYEEALRFDERSLQISTRLQDTLRMANTLNNIALIFDEQGRYRDAVKNYMSAYELYKKLNAPDKLALVNVNLGVVFKAMGDFDNSERNYRQALTQFLRTQQSYPVAVCYVNIGSVFLSKNQYDSALKYSLLAEKMFRELNYVRFEAVAIGNAGIAYGKLQQPREAEQYLNKAIALHQQNNNLKELAFCHLKKAEFQLDGNLLAGALASANAALQTATAAGALQQTADANLLLATIYQRLNDYPRAFQAQTRYLAARDSLFQQDKVRELRQLQAEFETEKKERELAESRVALAQSQLAIKVRSNQLVLASTGLVVALLAAFVVYRNQKVKNQQLLLKAELAQAQTRNALQEERLRISQELHDNIGSQLTFVKSCLSKMDDAPNSEPLKEVQRLTADTIRELRKTVWLINRDSATADEFIIKLRDYIPASLQTPIQVELQSKHEVVIKSQTANHLFRFAQEAINNTLKHADATQVQVAVYIEKPSELTLSVTDNGKGFDTATATDGFGLRNMNKRIASLNGRLTLQSQPGRTCVQATVPLS